MPDGKPTKRRKVYRKTRIEATLPAALKLDLMRIAGYERRPVSRVTAGLLRLGVARYFELADAKMIAPLKALMKDVFSEEEGAWIPDRPERPQLSESYRKRLIGAAARRELTEKFDAAIEEGKRYFETVSG